MSALEDWGASTDVESKLSLSSKNYSKVQLKAIRRLMKDLMEIKSSPIPDVHAEPIGDNLFLWHGNLRGPEQTPFAGGIFHITLEIPFDYPDSPPSVKILNEIPHPFVSSHDVSINFLNPGVVGEASQGWSPVYSIQTILLQLQSFLLDGLQTMHVAPSLNVSFSQKQTSGWKVAFDNKDERGEGTLSAEDIRDLLLEVGERKPSMVELALYYRMIAAHTILPIDFSTFLRLLQRKREYGRVVAAANRFTCPHPKCNHRAHRPFPEFPKCNPDDFKTKRSPEEIIISETRCFYSKASFQAPENATLGIGVVCSRHVRDNSLHTVSSPLDLLSLSSFRKQKVRKSADNSVLCTHWLPLYINAEHGQRAMHLAPRSLGVICGGTHRDFKPSHVLQVLPKLMNNVIVQIVKGSLHASTKALDGYCAYHRLFLALVQQYPELRDQVRASIDAFVADSSKRWKRQVPNLGEFICQASILEDYDVSSLIEAYVEEMQVRNVLFITMKHPKLDTDVSSPKIDRLRKQESFPLTATSYRVLLFHRYFLKYVAQSQKSLKDLADVYDSRCGRGTDAMVSSLIAEVKHIKALNTYEEFYRRASLKCPEDVGAVLRAAVTESNARNYHGPRRISVKSANEFLKDKMATFKPLKSMIVESASKKAIAGGPGPRKGKDKAPPLEELPSLISDEDTWKSMAQIRFGNKEPVEVDSKVLGQVDPWRHTYLQLNLQEILEKFNENPDFVAFYEALWLSGRHLRQIVYTVGPVTNVKSNYHFLTAMLTRLISLEKLVITKGNSTLGLKGCKALCKGLVNNPDSIRILDLHYTHFQSQHVRVLEEGLLASRSLIILNVEGNPVRDDGADSLAKVLKTHFNLQELNIGKCMMNVGGAKSLASAIYHNKSLKKLSISKNPMGQAGICDVLNQLVYSPTIEVLDLSSITLPKAVGIAASFTRLFEVNLSLKEIILYQTSCSSLNKEAFHALGKSRSIQKLDMASSMLTTTGDAKTLQYLGWAVAMNKNLTSLDLTNNSFTSCWMLEFFEAIYEPETTIAARLKAKLLRKLTVAELDEELRPRGASLEFLSLQGNSIAATTSRTATALQRFLSLTTSLVTLDISFCSLEVLAGDAIGRGLESHPSLKTLNLADNKLGEYGVKKLCANLAKNQVLEVLSLARNKIGGRGASAVGQMMGSNSSLKSLDLNGNLIGIEGARFIGAGLQQNKSITDLDLGLNRIRAKGTAAISEGCAKNSTLKVLRLKLNFINARSAIELVEVIVTNKSSGIERLCLAGNYVKNATLINCTERLSTKSVVLDVADHLKVTTPARMQNTVFCTPLPMDVSDSTLRKVFYDGGCGAIVNVTLFKHKKRSTYDKAMYAFVEFAEQGSLELALDIGQLRKAILPGKKPFTVSQAGCKR